MLLAATVALAGPRMIPSKVVPAPAGVGQPAPNFLFTQPDGTLVDLAQGDGKPLIVAFWASWCQACEPALHALTELDPHEMPVLAINVDQDRAMGEAWLRATGLDLPVAWDPEAKVLGRYRVTTLPALFLVDDAGNIVGHAPHPDGLPAPAREQGAR